MTLTPIASMVDVVAGRVTLELDTHALKVKYDQFRLKYSIYNNSNMINIIYIVIYI